MRRLTCAKAAAAIAVILAAVALTSACGGSEERTGESPSPSAATGGATSTQSPRAASTSPAPQTATAAPVASATPAPSFSLTVDGPSEAAPGDTLNYTLSYAMDDPELTIVVTWFSTDIVLTYASSAMAGGEGELVANNEYSGGGDVRWVLKGPLGQLQLVLNAGEVISSGSIRVGCYEPGTNARACENTVTTQVATGG